MSREAATDHVHEWWDADNDETAWHCRVCGLTEYPGDPGIGAVFECAADEYEALAQQVHDSIAEGQSVEDTAKMLRLLAATPSTPGLREAARKVVWMHDNMRHRAAPAEFSDDIDALRAALAATPPVPRTLADNGWAMRATPSADEEGV